MYVASIRHLHADSDPGPVAGPPLGSLPISARLYVAGVIALGVTTLVAFFPREYPSPVLFSVLMVFACVTSAWKVTLPIPVSNGSTLSVSYAANLMALLLLGPSDAILIAVAGALTQCLYRVRRPYPLYRTVFSAAGAAITMAVTGVVYTSLGGMTAPLQSSISLARPLVGAITAYFLVNTGLVAGAISLSTERTFVETWRNDFLWSGASFMVAGTAGALAAVVVERGEQWKGILLIAPIYLTYRTYELFVGRLEDQKRYVAEMRRLHEETVGALRQARDAEHALAGEKERLAQALAEMTRFEGIRKQLLEREQAARATAEHANRVKDQFLAVVSHELRTPMTAILGWTDLLRRGAIPDDQRDRAVETIYDSARRQAQLIEDLLDVSRIMSGKLRLDRKPIDPAEIVNAALSVVQPAADAKGVRIVVDINGDVGTINADAARLQQIVWNLLSNAVKFTPATGHVRVGLRRLESDVELAVTDTGEGIEPVFLPAVFEPFRQADGSTTRIHRGLGLGLSIVKSLVEAHGGTVTAESAGPGLGATFRVLVPGSTAAATRAREESRKRGMDAGLLQGVSVLVVDDDDASREVVAAHLHGFGAKVVTAASAAQALDLLQRHQLDVLLADIGMPEEDGYSLIRKVRALPRSPLASIPAAALTAFSRAEDRRLALDAGFQLHLAKPIDASSLVGAVASLARLNLR